VNFIGTVIEVSTIRTIKRDGFHFGRDTRVDDLELFRLKKSPTIRWGLKRLLKKC